MSSKIYFWRNRNRVCESNEGIRGEVYARTAYVGIPDAITRSLEKLLDFDPTSHIPAIVNASGGILYHGGDVLRRQRQQNISDRGVANTRLWVGNENLGAILRKWGWRGWFQGLETQPTPPFGRKIQNSPEESKILEEATSHDLQDPRL